jgi:hypothetical protein
MAWGGATMTQVMNGRAEHRWLVLDAADDSWHQHRCADMPDMLCLPVLQGAAIAVLAMRGQLVTSPRSGHATAWTLSQRGIRTTRMPGQGGSIHAVQVRTIAPGMYHAALCMVMMMC